MPTAVDFIAGKLQYRITAEDDTKAGVNSAIANVTRLDTATNRALTQFRRQYREGLLTLDQYGNLVAATFNNVANTAPAALNKVDASARRTGGSLMGLSNIMNSVWYGLVAGIATGAVFGLINFFSNLLSSITNFVSGVIQQSALLSGAMEQIKISFETLSGSASMAQEMYNWLWKFSIYSPFKFMDVAQATKQLQGYGFTWEQVKRTVQATGDAASALGADSETYGRLLYALGQVRAFNTLRGQEALQLVNAGIPVWDILAQKYGKSTGEVMALAEKKELASGEEIIDTLLTYFETKYKGAMARMNDTLLGQINQFQETIQYAMIQIGDVLNTIFAPILTYVNDKLSDWLPTLESWSNLVKGVVGDLKSFWTNITGLKGNESIDKFFSDLLDVIGPLAAALAFSNPIFTAISYTIIGLGVAIHNVFSQDFWEATYNFGKAFLLILDTMGNGLDIFTGLLTDVHGILDAILRDMVVVSEATLTIATILTDNSRSLGERLGDIWRWMMTMIIDVLQRGVVAGLAVIHIGGLKFLESIQTTINNIIDIINAGYKNIYNGFTGFFGKLLELGPTLGDIGKNLSGQFVNGLIDKAVSGINWLKNHINGWINSLPGIIKNYFGISNLGGISIGRVDVPNVSFSGLDLSSLKIPHVDLLGSVGSDWTNFMYGLVENVNSMIDDFQAKYGLNVTLDDLKKKYNVDTSGFDKLLELLKNLTAGGTGGNGTPPFSDDKPLKNLKDSIDRLGDKIDGKQWKFTLYFDVKVENAGNAEEVKNVGNTLQESVKKAISTAMAKGVTP